MIRTSSRVLNCCLSRKRFIEVRSYQNKFNTSRKRRLQQTSNFQGVIILTSSQRVQSNQLKIQFGRVRFFSTNNNKDENKPLDCDQVASASDSTLTQLKSIPNLITLSRIVGTPIISWLIINDEYQMAAMGCIVAGFTDWLDGFIAKKFDKSTVLGTYLDPLADKWTIFVLSSTLAYHGLLPPIMVFIWIGRDVSLIAATYYHVSIATRNDGRPVIDPAKTPLKIEPSSLSKTNTVLQFFTIALAIGFPIGFVSPIFPSQIFDGLCWITAGTTIVSGFHYSDGKSLKKIGNK